MDVRYRFKHICINLSMRDAEKNHICDIIINMLDIEVNILIIYLFISSKMPHLMHHNKFI